MSCTAGLRTLFLEESSITELVGDRVYVQTAPRKAALPYVLLSKISNDFYPRLDGTGGLIAEDVDVDCKASTPRQADRLAKAVREFFQDYTGTAGEVTVEAVIVNDETEGEEPPPDGHDQARFVTTLDFTVQHRE